MSTGLYTDHYEFTMLDAARRAGFAERLSVFEVFARRLPAGRRYGVVAGTARVTEIIESFRLDTEELAWLAETGIVSPATIDYLSDYRFRGRIDGYREGEVYFPQSPVLTVSGTFAQAVVLETAVLSALNYDSAVAGAAARIRSSTTSSLLEFGGRRTHEAAAVSAARAAYLAGFDATSNLAAGMRYRIPTAGTAAHAYTLLHDDETEAFVHQMEALGVETTLLVDTFDIELGIRNGVDAARRIGAPGPGAIRIDSGDLGYEARRARALLDSLGASETKIIVSGDLDEFSIAALERVPHRAPIDGYGVGTRVTNGSGHPTAGFVYKLVAVGPPGADTGADDALRPVEKTSAHKFTSGGRKRAWRLFDDRLATHEDLRTDGLAPPQARSLQVPIMRDGETVYESSLEDDREHHRRALDELGANSLRLEPGPPALTTLRNGETVTHPEPEREEAP